MSPASVRLVKCLRGNTAVASSSGEGSLAKMSGRVRALSTSALPTGGSEENHEAEKMVSEGGGSTASFQEKKAEISKGKGEAPAGTSEYQQTKEAAKDTWQSAGDMAKRTWQEGKEKGESVVGGLKGQVQREVDTAAEMLPRDIPKKVSEAGRGLGEVGEEAAQAIKRDASRVAEKVGLKSPSSYRSDGD